MFSSSEHWNLTPLLLSPADLVTKATRGAFAPLQLEAEGNSCIRSWAWLGTMAATRRFLLLDPDPCPCPTTPLCLPCWPEASAGRRNLSATAVPSWAWLPEQPVPSVWWEWLCGSPPYQLGTAIVAGGGFFLPAPAGHLWERGMDREQALERGTCVPPSPAKPGTSQLEQGRSSLRAPLALGSAGCNYTTSQSLDPPPTTMNYISV